MLERAMPSLNSHQCSLFSWIGAVVVFLWIAKNFYFNLKFLYSNLLGTLDLNIKWKDMGKWAVVTGGSDGIGKAYAEELARRGFNLVLISRTSEKLDAVAADISKTFFVETKTIVVDFTNGPEIYDKIENEIIGLEIGVLVNNVGMSYEYAEYFHAVPDGIKVMSNIIRSNIVACTMMMRMVLPQMEKRKKGVIINVSSLTALYPMPLLNVYSASKAFVDYLSRATQVEYKDKGIIIQSVLPGYVATKMSNRRTSLEIPSAETFVRSAIKTVGVESYTYGYFPHKIRGFVHEWLKLHMPEFVNMAIAMYYMKKSRDRYYKKSGRNVKKNSAQVQDKI